MEAVTLTTLTEFYRWYITDERTGKRRRTTYKLLGQKPHMPECQVATLKTPA